MRRAALSLATLFATLACASGATAVSGPASQGDASAAQYVAQTPTPIPTGTPQATSTPGEQETLPRDDTGGKDPDGQPPADDSASYTLESGAAGSDGGLPFTGGPLAPLLIAGLALTAVGIAVRRRTAAPPR